MELKRVFRVSVRLVFFFVLLVIAWVGSIPPALGEVEWERLAAWQPAEPPQAMALSQDGRWVYLLTANHKVLIYSVDGRLEGSIPVDPGVDNIAISVTGDVLLLSSSKKQAVELLAVDFIRRINIIGAPFLGPVRAPVELVVFSDFQCPYCSDLLPVLERVLELYPDTVKVVFKNFPLAIHPLAQTAALAALAAGEQGRFWEFHDQLFKYSAVLSNQRVNRIAAELGLDLVQFKRDMESPALRQKLDRDIRDGQGAGVGSTPVVFVNGRLARERSLGKIQEMIDKELNKRKIEASAQREKRE